MLRLRRMHSLQKFASVHGSVHNHFQADRSLTSRLNYKAARTAALADCRWMLVWSHGVGLEAELFKLSIYLGRNLLGQSRMERWGCHPRRRRWFDVSKTLSRMQGSSLHPFC